MTFWLRLYKNGKLVSDAVCPVDIKKSHKQILEDSLKSDLVNKMSFSTKWNLIDILKFTNFIKLY